MTVAFPLAVMVCGIGIVHAAEPKYDVIELNPQLSTPDMIKKMQKAASSFSSHRDPIASFKDYKAAEYYVKTHIPTMMTQPDSLEEVSSGVQEVLGYLNKAQRGNYPCAMEFLKWIYIGMKPIAEGNYEPIARINATLAIGKLDSRPADTIKQTPPVPLTYSLTVLLGLYENENNPEGVRAAALQGLRRYVTYGFYQLKPEERMKLTSLMKELLDAETPKNRSPEAHAYLQRYAVDILDALRTKLDPELAKELVSISADPKRPNLIALHSAAKAGKMKELKDQVDAPEEVLQSWTARVWQAVRGEQDRFKAFSIPSPAQLQPSPPESHLQVTSQPKKPTGGAGRIGGEGGRTESSMDSGMEGSYAGGGTGRGGMEMGSEMQEYSGMEMMGSGEYGMPTAQAIPQPPQVIASRKRLLYIIQQLHIGATGNPAVGMPKTPAGLLASVPEDKREVVEKWLTSMEAVVNALSGSGLHDELVYQKTLEEQASLLFELAGPAAQLIEEEERKANGGDQAVAAAGGAAPAGPDAGPRAAAVGAAPIVPAAAAKPTLPPAGDFQ